MSIATCMSSSENCLFRFFAHLLKLDCLFFGVELYKFLILNISCIIGKYVLPFSGLSSHFVNGYLCYQNSLVSHSLICYLIFCFPCQEDTAEKILVQEMSKFYCLCFKSYIKVFNPFEFIFVYCIRRWSSLIFCMYLSNFPNVIY